MSEPIIVRVTLDAYDMASTGRQTQVYVQIPEVARGSWLLPDDRFHGLKDRAWPEVLDVTHDYVTYGGAASNSSGTAAWKAVMEWLRDDANRDEMQAAWEQDQARRHPVARKLLVKVTELEAELYTEQAHGRTFLEQRNAHAKELLELRSRVAELEARLAKREQSAGTYPPALPWARLMDHEDLSDFLDELAASAGTPGSYEGALATVENVIATHRLIAEAQHAHNTAPGPNAEELRSCCAGPVCTCTPSSPQDEEYIPPREDDVPTTVYRASHDSIVMGLYTTAAAARAHCEALVRREYTSSGIADLKLSWREDGDTVDQPEDGEQELIEHVGPHFARPTGYVVTPLDVAAAYDEEADE